MACHIVYSHITVIESTHHICHFTKERFIKSSVSEHVINVLNDFYTSLDDLKIIIVQSTIHFGHEKNTQNYLWLEQILQEHML